MPAGEKVDIKRNRRELYAARREPTLIDVPEMAFLMIDGHGNPNTPWVWARPTNADPMRIHPIQTGWVQIKSKHVESRFGPRAAQALDVLADRTWSPRLRIGCWQSSTPTE